MEVVQDGIFTSYFIFLSKILAKFYFFHHSNCVVQNWIQYPSHLKPKVKSYQKLHLLQSADKRPKIAQFKYTNREDTSNYGTDIGDKMRKRLGSFSDQNLISEVEIKCNGNRWKIKISQTVRIILQPNNNKTRGRIKFFLFFEVITEPA